MTCPYDDYFLGMMPAGFHIESYGDGESSVYLIRRLDAPYQVHCELGMTSSRGHTQARLTFGAGYRLEAHVEQAWRAIDNIVDFLKNLARTGLHPHRLRREHG